MSVKRTDFVDCETGEVLAESVAMLVPQRIPNGFKEGWFSMSQAQLKVFIEHRKDLGLEGFSVLMALLQKLDFQNLILVSQAELGRELGMHRQHVNAAIKKLAAMGAILEGPKVGQSRTYRLDPTFGWKGSSKNHHKALRTAEKAKAAGLTVHKGGKASAATDEALRTELEADGQGRLID